MGDLQLGTHVLFFSRDLGDIPDVAFQVAAHRVERVEELGNFAFPLDLRKGSVEVSARHAPRRAAQNRKGTRHAPSDHIRGKNEEENPDQSRNDDHVGGLPYRTEYIFFQNETAEFP